MADGRIIKSFKSQGNTPFGLASTDLADSTTWDTGEYYFKVPAGCILIHVNLRVKTSGDIIWFDETYLIPKTNGALANGVVY